MSNTVQLNLPKRKKFREIVEYSFPALMEVVNHRLSFFHTFLKIQLSIIAN